MESIIYKISDENVWEEYLQFKKNQTSAIKSEIKYMEEYIKEKRYSKIVNEIIRGSYNFSIPIKHLINKVNKQSKRVVYTFNEDETMVLKLITYLVSEKYDCKYSSNCYSFRRKYTVKQAIYNLTEYEGIKNFYGYKIDIHNYFNSIDIELLLPKLKEFFGDDYILYNFLKNILLDDRAYLNNEIVHEKKGIMAGIPISSFLANIYLLDLDEYFLVENVLYARYSDDIILFSDKEKIDKYVKVLNDKIKFYRLEINEEKCEYILPNEKWNFLGFSYQDGVIDLSDSVKKKIKGKIKRMARKLRRWMLKKHATPKRAISAMNRTFNRKFYSKENGNELTWSMWYFPIINTDNGLSEVDKYMQQYLRYIATGRHCKKNFNITYEFLKECGYRPLVSEYYSRKLEQ